VVDYPPFSERINSGKYFGRLSKGEVFFKSAPHLTPVRMFFRCPLGSTIRRIS